MQSLPVDVLHHIFGFLTPRDVCGASWVCRTWRSELTEDAGGWSRLCTETWPVSAEPLISSPLAGLKAQQGSAQPNSWRDFISRAHNSYWRHSRVKTAKLLYSASHGYQRIWLTPRHPAIILDPPWVLVSDDVIGENHRLWILDLRKPPPVHAAEMWSHWSGTAVHTLIVREPPENPMPAVENPMPAPGNPMPAELPSTSQPETRPFRPPTALSYPFVLQAKGCEVLLWIAQTQTSYELCSSALPSPVLAVALESRPHCIAGDPEQATFTCFAAACSSKVRVWTASATHLDSSMLPHVDTALVWESTSQAASHLTILAIWASQRRSGEKTAPMNLALGTDKGIQLLCLSPSPSSELPWSVWSSLMVPLGGPTLQMCVTWDPFPRTPHPSSAPVPANPTAYPSSFAETPPATGSSTSPPFGGTGSTAASFTSRHDARPARLTTSHFSRWRMHALVDAPDAGMPFTGSVQSCRSPGVRNTPSESGISNPRVTPDSLASTLARMRVDFRNAAAPPPGAVPCTAAAHGPTWGPRGGTEASNVGIQGYTPDEAVGMPSATSSSGLLPPGRQIVCLRGSELGWPRMGEEDGGAEEGGRGGPSTGRCGGGGGLSMGPSGGRGAPSTGACGGAQTPDGARWNAGGGPSLNLDASQKSGDTSERPTTSRMAGDGCHAAGDNRCVTKTGIPDQLAGDNHCRTNEGEPGASPVVRGLGEGGQGPRERRLGVERGGEGAEIVWRRAAPRASHISVGDGLLAVGCDDGGLNLWDSSTGNHVRRVPNPVVDRAAANSYVITYVADCRVWVGDLGCGGPAAHLLSLTEMNHPVSQRVVYPDGSYAYDMAIRLHAVAPREQVRCTCGHVAVIRTARSSTSASHHGAAASPARRSFYSCGRRRGQTCDFYEYID